MTDLGPARLGPSVRHEYPYGLRRWPPSGATGLRVQVGKVALNKAATEWIAGDDRSPLIMNRQFRF